MLNKNIKIIISLVLLIAIGFGILEVFRIEKKSINEEDSQTQKTSELPLPSRIVYKNKYNKYKIPNITFSFIFLYAFKTSYSKYNHK